MEAVMFTVSCSSCTHEVKFSGDRPPPWCPRCGGEVRGSPKLAATGALSLLPFGDTPGPVPAVERRTREEVQAIPRRPFFHVREVSSRRRIYRVYAVGSDLLFIHVTGSHQARTLDTASEASLRQLASEEGSFSGGDIDLQGVQVNPPSKWVSILYGSDHAGLLLFHHATLGKKKLELPTLDDVRLAVMMLPQVLGECVKVNVC
jgi:hypothetical protein